MDQIAIYYVGEVRGQDVFEVVDDSSDIGLFQGTEIACHAFVEAYTTEYIKLHNEDSV